MTKTFIHGRLRSISKGYTLLPNYYRSASRTECENEMIDLNELTAHLEVQTNILNEQRRIAEQKRRNITAMLEASNKESM
jgi:hypothetical protein